MGRLTTHVLDTAQGRPGAGIPVALYAVNPERRLVKTLITNDDGRADEPLLQGQAFATGTWELVFSVGEYYSRSSLETSDPPFLDEVSIRFTISSDEHYHVPLLVSPWSYSTYRGS